MSLRRTLGVAVIALTLAGCSAANEDAASSSTNSSTVATTSDTPAMTPAPPAPAAPADRPQGFRDYLASINVTGAPVHLDQAPGLTVTVPVPEGWAQTSDPLFSTGVEFIQPVGQSGNAPSVTLMAVELTGPFDPKDAIRHANADALPPAATDVTESYDDYDGFPSAAAQGVTASTQHYNRIVLADVPSTGKRYLVQLTVTTPADQLIAANPPLKGVVAGFKVAVS